MLRELQSAGHGSFRAVSFQPDPNAGVEEPGCEMIIDKVLSNATFAKVNAYAQNHLDVNLRILLDPDQVIRVPTLFRNGIFGWRSSDGLLPRGTPIL